MSWPLASFTLVAVVLLVGWLAYERSRPSARTIALVATLSALAALGRDAFAAFAEVKPITAMTFVVGYTLGPLPGFVVGAMGMLVSNMIFGQGPYTPWQMAAWGMVGLLGAVTGRIARGRMRRLPLALCCAFAALVAKEVMDFYTWTIGAAHTPAAFVLVVGQALPFDVLDVASTFLFGLAFGPELARLLLRMRERTVVHWEPPPGASAGGALVLIVAVVVVALSSPARARATNVPMPRASTGSTSMVTASTGSTSMGSTSAVSARMAGAAAGGVARAVAYLASAQNADGGFGAAPHDPSTAMYTSWAVIGLASAGRDPLELDKDGHSPLSVIKAQAGSPKDAGGIERAILALRACGLPAQSFGGHSLVSSLLRHRKRNGSFGGQVNLTAFAILALRAASGAGRPASTAATVAAAARWIVKQQNGEGGFSFATRGDPSDIDDTAAAMQALVAAHATMRTAHGAAASRVATASFGEALSRATRFLRHAEDRDGGFPLEPGEESNAQSTAWAIQGLLAAHRLSALASGGAPIAYLESLMQRDGSIRYSKHSSQTPIWVTAEALAALAGKPLPVAPPDRDAAGLGTEVTPPRLNHRQVEPARSAASAGESSRAAVNGADSIAEQLLRSVGLLVAPRG